MRESQGKFCSILFLLAAGVKSEKGTMRFVPLEAGTWPVLFEEVIGSAAEPHAP